MLVAPGFALVGTVLALAGLVTLALAFAIGGGFARSRNRESAESGPGCLGWTLVGLFGVLGALLLIGGFGLFGFKPR